MKTRILTFFLVALLASTGSAQIAPVYSLTAPDAGGGVDFLRFDLNQGTQTLVRHFSTQEMMTIAPGAAYDYDHERYIGSYVNAHWENALVSIDLQTGNVVHDFVPTQVDRLVGVYGDGLLYIMSQDLACRATLWTIHMPTQTETMVRTYNAQELSLEFRLMGYDRDQGVLYGQDYNMVQNRYEIVTLDPANGQVLTRQPLQDWNLNGLFYTPGGIVGLGVLNSSDGWYNNLLRYDTQSAAVQLVQGYQLSDPVQLRAWGGVYDYENQRIVTVEGYVTADRTLTALDAQTGALLTTLVCTSHQITGLISTGKLAVATGSTDGQHPRMMAYPNPTSSTVTFSGLRPGSAYTIMDVWGRTVLQGRVTEEAVDLSTLPAGTYLLQVKAGTELHTQHVIKQ